MIVTAISPFKTGVLVKKRQGLSAPKKVKGKEKRSSRLLKRKTSGNILSVARSL